MATAVEEGTNLCVVCNKLATRRCKACAGPYYCSAEHQKSHWKETHTKGCVPYKLVENAQLGRHYIARRDIEAGEVVLSEQVPLLMAPSYMKSVEIEGSVDRIVKFGAIPVCLNCYAQLRSSTSKPCAACGWPLCPECEEHGIECAFTKKHRKWAVKIPKKEFGKPSMTYAMVAIAKALALRLDDPEAYRKLMNLQDVPDVPAATEARETIAKAAQFAKTFFRIRDVDEDEIRKIFGRILINSHSRTKERKIFCVVYDRTSYFEHNCRPNLAKTFNGQLGITLTAAMNIPKGEHLSTTYVKPLWGTKQRKEHLLLTKFFECTCKRCEDPTEFGTMLNAIKCPHPCCGGYALPPTFKLIRDSFADYVCRKCKKPCTALSYEIQQDIIDDRLWLFSKNANECHDYIKKWKPYLHENNCRIVEIEFHIFLIHFQAMEALKALSTEYILSVVKLCTKLCTLYKILAPAENRTRASLLCLKFVGTRTINYRRTLTLEQTLPLIKVCEKDLIEAKALSSNPSDSMECFTLLSVCTSLTRLQDFKKAALEKPPDAEALKAVWDDK